MKNFRIIFVALIGAIGLAACSINGVSHEAYNEIVTELTDPEIPDIMVVRIPGFRAVATEYGGYEDWWPLLTWGWQEERRENYFETIIFDCHDFLLRRGDSFQYLMAINDDITESDTAPYGIIDFAGGLYATAVCMDDSDASLAKVENKIFQWLENTRFEYDDSRDVMGHMPYIDDEIKKGLGYEQLQRYVPIKLRGE